MNQTEVKAVFQFYIYPLTYLVIFSVGSLWNGVLLLMFIKHRNLRTPANIMVFNLVLSDIMNIYANAPLYYLSKYHCELIYFGGQGCRVFSIFRFVNHAVIELSVLALCVQRFIATSAKFYKSSNSCEQSKKMNTFIYLLSVWILSLLLALPCGLLFEFRHNVCFPIAKNSAVTKITDVIYAILFCFMIPIPLLVLSVLTAKRLRESVKLIPGETRNASREETRFRSARVVIALVIAYALTHVPRAVWFFCLSYLELDRLEVKFMLIDEVTNYLMFIHSIVNPVALYIASKLYKSLFNKYLFFSCIKYVKEKKLSEHSPATLASSYKT